MEALEALAKMIEDENRLKLVISKITTDSLNQYKEQLLGNPHISSLAAIGELIVQQYYRKPS